jgi:hypothetical protein
MSRRRFEHLVVEISVRIGWRVPRYALWLRLHHQGMDPEALSRSAAVAFCQEPLQLFLAEHGVLLPARHRRRLLRSVERFDPDHPTPEEFFSSRPV